MSQFEVRASLEASAKEIRGVQAASGRDDAADEGEGRRDTRLRLVPE